MFLDMDEASPARPRLANFSYVKSSHFATCSADGVIGSIHPQGKGIRMCFFIERSPYPNSATHEMVEIRPGEFTLGREIKRDGGDFSNLERELQFETYFDVEVATRVHAWLGQRLKELTTTTQLKPQPTT